MVPKVFSLNIIAVSYLYEAHQREIKTKTHKVK